MSILCDTGAETTQSIFSPSIAAPVGLCPQGSCQAGGGRGDMLLLAIASYSCQHLPSDAFFVLAVVVYSRNSCCYSSQLFPILIASLRPLSNTKTSSKSFLPWGSEVLTLWGLYFSLLSFNHSSISPLFF